MSNGKAMVAHLIAGLIKKRYRYRKSVIFQGSNKKKKVELDLPIYATKPGKE